MGLDMSRFQFSLRVALILMLMACTFFAGWAFQQPELKRMDQEVRRLKMSGRTNDEKIQRLQLHLIGQSTSAIPTSTTTLPGDPYLHTPIVNRPGLNVEVPMPDSLPEGLIIDAVDETQRIEHGMKIDALERNKRYSLPPKEPYTQF